MSSLTKSAQNQARNLEDFEERKTELSSYPQMIFVELTLNCNLYCHMCRPKGKYLPELNMPFDLFRRIADELFPHAKIVDLRGSGESTILVNFLKYVEYATKFNIQLKLITNLTVQNDELWEHLVQNNFILGVSFDAATKEKFEQLRRGSRFNAVVSNLIKLVSFSNKHNTPVENIYLTVVVQKDNLLEIPDILWLAHQIGIKRIKLFPIKCSEQSPHNLIHYADQVRSMLNDILSLANKLHMIVEVSAALHPTLVIENSIPRPCIHPWMYCYIDYQGGVGFCDHLIGKPQYILGNINATPFLQIWNGPGFQALRKEHIEQEFSSSFAACAWCYSNRYIDLEHLCYPPYSQLTVVNNLRKESLYGEHKNG